MSIIITDIEDYFRKKYTPALKNNDMRIYQFILIPTNELRMVICSCNSKLDGKQENIEWILLDKDNQLLHSEEKFDFLRTISERVLISKIIADIYPNQDISKMLLKMAIHFKTYYPDMRIEVENIDDIPTNSIDVPPIDLTGLPQHNFIKGMIDFVGETTHAYPEYTWQNSVSMLSSIVRRRLSIHIDSKEYYTNTSMITLANSGDGKSPAFDKGAGIMEKAVKDPFLSQPGSIQGLRKEVADEILRQERKTGLWIPEPKVPHTIRRAECALWLDEAGSLFSMLNMKFSDGEKDFLNNAYSSNDKTSDKILSGERIKTGTIYMPMNLCLTESKYKQTMNFDDVNSGFHVRFSPVYPTYYNKIQDHKGYNPSEDLKSDLFSNQLKLIDKLLMSVPLRVPFVEGSECFKAYNEWSIERHDYFKKTKNTMMASFWSKMQINVLKMAILIELGNLPAYLTHYIKDKEKLEDTITISDCNLPKMSLEDIEEGYKLLNEKFKIKEYKIKSFDIGIQSLKLAMHIYDTMYLKYVTSLFGNYSDNKYKTYVQQFYEIVKEKTKVTRSEMMKKIYVEGKKMDECEAVFCETGDISVFIHKVTKPTTVYVYTPQASREYPFKKVISMDNTPNNAVIVLTKMKDIPQPKSFTKASDKAYQEAEPETVNKIVEIMQHICDDGGYSKKEKLSDAEKMQVDLHTTLVSRH